MLQITYASSVVGLQSETSIAEILDNSRRNNRRDKLTGMLLAAGQCYFQVLEGPMAKVNACFERLQLDPRQSNILVTSRSPIMFRLFPDWAMECANLDDLGASVGGTSNTPNLALRVDTAGLARHAPS